jgi:hypothetical protein
VAHVYERSSSEAGYRDPGIVGFTFPARDFMLCLHEELARFLFDDKTVKGVVTAVTNIDNRRLGNYSVDVQTVSMCYHLPYQLPVRS